MKWSPHNWVVFPPLYALNNHLCPFFVAQTWDFGSKLWAQKIGLLAGMGFRDSQRAPQKTVLSCMPGVLSQGSIFVQGLTKVAKPTSCLNCLIFLVSSWSGDCFKLILKWGVSILFALNYRRFEVLTMLKRFLRFCLQELCCALVIFSDPLDTPERSCFTLPQKNGWN